MSGNRLLGVQVAMCMALIASLAIQSEALGQQSGANNTPANVRKRVTELIDEIIESDVELNVTLRRSKIIRTKLDIFRVAVADPTKVEPVQFSLREVELIGMQAGSTTVTLWMGNEQQARLLSILVNVNRDKAVEDRKRLEFGELQQLINNTFPNSKIQLIPIADKLIVRGQVRDELEISQIMSVIRAQALTLNNTGASGQITNQGTAADPFPDTGQQQTQPSVINMLRVPGVKQVLLKVRIAEIKRSAIRELGTDFNLDIGDFILQSSLGALGNIIASGTFDNDSFNLMLRALSSNGNAKILAEPNLVVLSGQTATFISGGEFAVPTVVGVGGAQASTTTFKGFGTQLTFTPTVLDRDRIRLTVVPTFSTLNRANSVNGIFGVDTRSVSTTVELREGQVLAIAGLLQEQQRGDNARVPLIGDIPYLNSIFANKSISRDETELIILISPELVHPLEPEEAPSILPGMEMTEPDDIDFFIKGEIEGRPCCDHRSTVWPLYRNRLYKCGRKCNVYNVSESYYIHGPIGLSR
ncbi:MAG: pilus assembly protein N-terminal domain-containing protein [Planctomycetes bacterium]|nr:pilus assembly protein N-terminal domain-containing protein [Planctomycetota bacterium]